VQILNAEAFDNVGLQRIAGFGAEASNAFSGIVATERGQIHARYRAQQPSSLVVFLNRTARHVGSSAAFDRAGVYANLVYPVAVERDLPVAFKRAAAEHNGNGFNPVRKFCWLECHLSVSIETQEYDLEILLFALSLLVMSADDSAETQSIGQRRIYLRELQSN
jgi:hypothetical protein